jgi:hypothetical protein
VAARRAALLLPRGGTAEAPGTTATASGAGAAAAAPPSPLASVPIERVLCGSTLARLAPRVAAAVRALGGGLPLPPQIGGGGAEAEAEDEDEEEGSTAADAPLADEDIIPALLPSFLLLVLGLCDVLARCVGGEGEGAGGGGKVGRRAAAPEPPAKKRRGGAGSSDAAPSHAFADAEDASAWAAFARWARGAFPLPEVRGAFPLPEVRGAFPLPEVRGGGEGGEGGEGGAASASASSASDADAPFAPFRALVARAGGAAAISRVVALATCDREGVEPAPSESAARALAQWAEGLRGDVLPALASIDPAFFGNAEA